MNVIEGDMHLIGIRPEHLTLDPAAPFRGRVRNVESTGADRFARVATPRGDMIVRLTASRPLPAAGEEVGIAFDDARLRRFDRTTGALLA